MLKRSLQTVIFLVIVLFSGNAIAASVDVNLTINQKIAWVGGQSSKLSIAPFEEKGVTYVPLRFVGEALGAQVDWVGQTKSVTYTLNGKKITLFIGSKKIYIDGVAKFTEAVPRLKDNYAMVPLRLISEALGATVNYNPLGRVITIKATQPPIAQFDIIPENVYVGEPVRYYEYSYDPDGDAIVDWQWSGREDAFFKAGTYSVGLRVKDVNGRWSTWTTKNIVVNEIPNDPPQAYFTVDKPSFAQGETINYRDASTDPEGDRIVEYKWTGNKKAFFKEGSYPVTLTVKDEKGNWSEPYTANIQITDEILLNEFQYNLANPVAGEIFPFMGISDSDFTTIQPKVTTDNNVTLFYSNSPEKVTANGILYADTLQGHIRLMYHHRNTSDKSKRFYLIAENTSDKDVTLKYLKGGFAGPSKDDFRVGQFGIMRYLESYYDRVVVIPPGKRVTVNIGSNELLSAKTGESIYGLYEVEASDNLKFMTIALDEGKNLDANMPYMQPLARDVHSRGTFVNADRTFTVEAKRNTRFIIADGSKDQFLLGYDAITGLITEDRGNYGVMYDIKIKADTPLTVIANPRGGGFAGTFALDGKYFYAPTVGGFAFNTTSMVTMLGTIGRDATLTFTPPASSNLPIYINFLGSN